MGGQGAGQPKRNDLLGIWESLRDAMSRMKLFKSGPGRDPSWTTSKTSFPRHAIPSAAKACKSVQLVVHVAGLARCR